MINDHIATPSAIFDELLPCGVRHGIPADMSIIIFLLFCYPVQKTLCVNNVKDYIRRTYSIYRISGKTLKEKNKKIERFDIQGAFKLYFMS